MTDATEAAALLSRKKRSRSGHRASTTRLINQATTALAAEELDADQLALTKQMLLEKAETLKALNGEIAELVPDDDLEEEIQQVDEYKERVYRVLAKLNKVLQPTTTAPPAAVVVPDPPPPVEHPPHVEMPGPPVEHPPSVETQGPAVGSLRVTPTETHPSTISHTKLPKIGLPHFRGNLMKWTAFWDSFNSSIHTNSQLSEVDKFNYLRSLLEGTAYDAIAGLTLSAANYMEAVEILKKRFGNRQLIISKHMESLLSVNAVTSDNHLRDLRRLYDRAEANIRSLKALGVEPETYGTMLSSVLLNKLPPDIRLIVSRKVSADDLDLDSLLETFEQELVARERASNSVSQPPRRAHNQGQSATTAFVANAPGSPECAYCQRSHSATDCKSVTDLNARKRILRNSGCCFNCLRKNHLSRNCRSSSKCKHCQGRHHTSICDRGSQPKENPSLATPTDLNPEAPAYNPPSTTNTLCSTKRKSILLQTARTVVHNPLKPEVTAEVRLLFDSGSQRSYLTE